MLFQHEEEKHARYLEHSQNLPSPSMLWKWLNQLGVKHLPDGLSIEDYVTRGWITPTLRVELPDSLFETWSSFPELQGPYEKLPKEDEWSEFIWVDWNGLSYPQSDYEWFLHPFDRNDFPQRIKGHEVTPHFPFTKPKKHKRNARTYYNTQLYFSHWHGYQLIDLIHAQTISSNDYLTPKKIDNISNNIQTYEELIASKIQKVIASWKDRAKIFTFISFYRSLCGYSAGPPYNHADMNNLQRAGISLLATHLNIDLDQIKSDFKNQLLVMYQGWSSLAELGSITHRTAISNLQKDIYYIVMCLSRLEQKNFSEYFDHYKYPTRDRDNWAQLKEALPYEYLTVKDDFVLLAPTYLNDLCSEIKKYKNPEDLSALAINNFWPQYQTFQYFTRSFYAIHKNLNMLNNTVIDFRDHHLANNILSLAIRSETFLSEAIQKDIPQNQSPPLKRIIELYKPHLPANSCLYEGVDKALSLWKNSTNLSAKQTDIFINILNSTANTSHKPKDEFAKHLLVLGISRNYFAHHYYLDGTFTQKEIRLMLVGILSSVLYLVASKDNFLEYK